MGTGWRSAFCTSIRRDAGTASPAEIPRVSSPAPTPRKSTKLSFFGKSGRSGGGGGGAGEGVSNPSTPRVSGQQMMAEPAAPALRCKTKPAAAAAATVPTDAPFFADVVGSPKQLLQCKASFPDPKSEPVTPGSRGRSPRLPFFSSNPSSPRSPSRFALLKNNLRLTRSSCGICLQSVKAKQGTAIFTAECSHVFHFHCIAASVRRQGSLVCPVCRSAWHQVPVLSDLSSNTQLPEEAEQENQKMKLSAGSYPRKFFPVTGDDYLPRKEGKGGSDAGTRVYSDDEPLQSSVAGRFNPILEADEELLDEDDKEGGEEEFRGFFSVDPSPVSSPRTTTPRRQLSGGGVQATVHPTVALLSSGRTHENYVIAVKVKAPSSAIPSSYPVVAGAGGSAAPVLEPASRRAPIDLVTVLDVGGNMTSTKLHMMKRAMRLVIASLGATDRLSIVGFSTAAKRLLPLRRMTPEGQRAARRIVDRLVRGAGSCPGVALKKAVKVLEDRRERNPVASIMLLSDGHQQQKKPGEDHQAAAAAASPRSVGGGVRNRPTSPSSDAPFSPNTRFSHLEIPFPAPAGTAPSEINRREDAEDVFARCVEGLLSVVLQDVRLEFSFPSGEVCSVYACGGRPASLGGGSGPLRLGDMYADEERELLVEVRVPCLRRAADLHNLSVRCTYRDPSTQELVHGREQPLLVPLAGRSHPPAATPKVDRLRDLFVTNRSVVEARRLADHGDFTTGLHLLSSARRLLQHSNSVSAEDDIRAVDAELEQLRCRRHQVRRYGAPETPTFPAPDDGAGGDALTPTSAWRAAERLAKVAIMRKSVNRVSDLHGFENARF